MESLSAASPPFLLSTEKGGIHHNTSASYDALLAFLGTFSAIEGDVDVATLNDGVQILDCLSEM